MSNAEEFVRYSVSDGKGWFEVGAVQMNISERLFASSVGEKQQRQMELAGGLL